MQDVTNPYASPTAAVADLDQPYGEARIFSFTGRLGRVRFIAYSAAVWLVIGLAQALFLATGLVTPGTDSVFTVVPGLLVLIGGFVLIVRRCHDCDDAGWWSLLILVPFVNIIFGLFLLFMTGTRGDNRYGPQTPPNGAGVIALAWILPVFFVIGILAAISIPAYQKYVQRAQAQQMLQGK